MFSGNLGDEGFLYETPMRDGSLYFGDAVLQIGNMWIENREGRSEMKRIVSVLLVLVMVCGAMFAQGGAEETWPNKNINLTVPYNAGGTTDLSGRALANGMLAFCTMPINGYTDKTFRDWDIWIATYAPNAIIVPKNSPYDTIEDLVAAIKANPGQITAGTGGIGSGGHFGAETIKAIAGADYKHITYAGGAAAVTATLSGEVDFCPQLLAEYKDLVIAGEVKALACLAEEDIEIAPGVVIPSILRSYPEAKKFVPMGEVTGVLIPKGLDEAKLAKLDAAFESAVKEKDFLDFCEVKSFSVIPMGRAQSQAYMEGFASKACYLMYDAGATTIDPAKFGINR